MDFIARDLESVPILLAKALATDEMNWTVELYAPGPGPWNNDEPGELLVSGHLITTTDWTNCVIQPTDDSDEPRGVPRVIPWYEVGTIVVP